MIKPAHNVGFVEREEIVKFIIDNYGDIEFDSKDVQWVVDHAVSIFPHQGGFILKAYDNRNLVGVAVINKNGIEKILPNFFLSFLAVRSDTRKEGIGKLLVKKSLQMTNKNVFAMAGNSTSRQFLENVGFKTKSIYMKPV